MNVRFLSTWLLIIILDNIHFFRAQINAKS